MILVRDKGIGPLQNKKTGYEREWANVGNWRQIKTTAVKMHVKGSK